MNVLHKILEWIMNNCDYLCGNYGFAIILFTLVSKLEFGEDISSLKGEIRLASVYAAPQKVIISYKRKK